MSAPSDPGPNRYRLADLTWVELQARIEAGPPVVILPSGALEQHGPHLPLSTDTVMPSEVALRVAALMDGVVAPALPYGYKSQPKSGGGNHFPGCASLDGTTYIHMVRDLICDFARHGMTKIVLMDGHMENQWFLTEAADLALRALKAEGVTGTKIVKLGYWTYLTGETEAALFPEGLISWELEHAAVMETSCMLHLRPDLVRADLIPDGDPADFPLHDVYPVDTGPIPDTGVLSSAAGATAEKGRIVLDQIVPDIAAALTAAFAE